MTTHTDALDRLLARSQQLYSLPVVAMRVLELTDNPHVDTRALKECIENDPALTAKILRVVNSSLFGLSREVSDLNQALALLGTKPLKLLVLGFSLPPGLFQGVACEILDWYWRRTLTRAVAAREISETVWRQPGDEPFIAALLCDLGMLLLIQELGRYYQAFLEKARAWGGDIAALEAQALGFDHVTVTAELLSRWRLPDALVDAINPARAQAAGRTLSPATKRTAEIVEVADLVARVLVDDHPEKLKDLLAVGLRDHALRPEQLERLVDGLERKVDQLAEVLSVRLTEGPAYAEVLARAHARLAATAEAAAEEIARRNGEALFEEIRGLSAAVQQYVPRVAPETATAPCSKPAPAEAAGPSAAQLVATPPAIDAETSILNGLTVAVAACRQLRCPLSLLLVELCDVNELVLTRGVEGFQRLLLFVERACRGLDHPSVHCLPFREAGFAVLLPDCERRAAVGLANQLLDRLRRHSQEPNRSKRHAVSLGVGVATVAMPPRNFPPQDLLEAATRCLNGSNAAGGGVVKSIEIY
ncbi:MAG: HDOD domain-containing protein [Thermoguttaceae bacterium]|jgi:HD-like signal output (HDOD) protein/GGDEF domain-containing protein|nr:HDOD domain-containing protein [Thermoguttaceae bacterium]